MPGKNLRLVGGEPLVARTIRLAVDACNLVGVEPAVVVSTDSPRIAAAARAVGAGVVDRPAHLADGDTPVHVAVTHTVETLGWDGAVLVLQPTCATLTPTTLADGLNTWLDSVRRGDPLASVVGCTDDRHLRWDENGVPPRRVNRQQQRPTWRETGWFLCSEWPAPHAPDPVDAPMYGFPCRLHEVDAHEAVDVDTPADLAAASMLARRRRVLVVAQAGGPYGTGHLRRQLVLAEALGYHDVAFASDLLDERCQKIAADAGVAAVPLFLALDAWDTPPDLVVVDVADEDAVPTRVDELGPLVVFENVGRLSHAATLVINDLYGGDVRAQTLAGPRWAVLDPLLRLHAHRPAAGARRVVVTFGGTDPAGMTQWVCQALAREAVDVRVVAPPAGCMPPVAGPRVDVVRDPVMPVELAEADLVVTSAGRTRLECACVGVPCVSIPVNLREAGHTPVPGVVQLPPRWEVTPEQLRHTVAAVMKDVDLRRELSAAGRQAVDGRGVERVGHAIEGLLLA